MFRKVFPVVFVIILMTIWPASLSKARSQADTITPTPTPARWLTVATPNGGEVMSVGDIYRITWTSSPNIDKVFIGYKSCPSCLDWIATNVPNSGYYDWTVFVGNTTNTQFTIEIIGYQTGYGSTTDYSDAPFTVLKSSITRTPTVIPTINPSTTPTGIPANTDTPSPTLIPALSLTVKTPNGGEVMTVGDTYRIAWDSSSNIDKITIGYKSCPSCLDWIAYDIPNSGYYDWTVFVGNTTNTQFTIEIIGYQTGYGSTTDYSDAPFTVLQPPTPTSTFTYTPTLTSTPTPTSTPIPQLGVPVLISPINGRVITTIYPVFDWTDVSGATGYTIQVSRYSNFSNLLINTNRSVSTYTASIKLPRGVVLYWRVRALGQPTPSSWSSSTFKIK